MLRISLKDNRTNVSILQELCTKRELFYVIYQKNNDILRQCNAISKVSFIKDTITGKIQGRRSRGRPKNSL